MSILQRAKEEGKKHLDIKSGDIHKELALQNRMPSVCNAIYSFASI
ncbi:MAG: hypothetical protein ABF649_19580 [Bacillus sp. (in: firmicutes)]